MLVLTMLLLLYIIILIIINTLLLPFVSDTITTRCEMPSERLFFFPLYLPDLSLKIKTYRLLLV